MRRHHYRSADDSAVTLHAVIERLAELPNVEWIRPQESWQSNERRYNGRSGYVVLSNDPYKSEWRTTPARPELPVEYSTSYGDWDTVRDTDQLTADTYVLLQDTAYSDYSGSIVNQANHKDLEETLQAIGLEDGEQYLDYYGGHGTRVLAVRVASLTPDSETKRGWVDSLLETLESLTDYPVVDESTWSELEMESQNEAWESWGKREYQQELGKHYARILTEQLEIADYYGGSFGPYNLAVTLDLVEYAENWDWVTDDLANQTFYVLADLANEYWVNEQGTDSYIDVADVVKKGLADQLNPNFPRHAETLARQSEVVRQLETALSDGYIADWYQQLADGIEKGGR